MLIKQTRFPNSGPDWVGIALVIVPTLALIFFVSTKVKTTYSIPPEEDATQNSENITDKKSDHENNS